MASNYTLTNSSISDEDNWVIHIDKMFRELNLDYLRDYPVCIYNVPKSLSSAKPEAFTPQLVALGPYHHFRPELYPMERLKLTAAKRVLNNMELNHVVKNQNLSTYSPKIRACFHKYLDFKDDTLVYIMVIDALFLLDFLQHLSRNKDQEIHHAEQSNNDDNEEAIPLQKIKRIMENAGVKLTKNAIIRDVVMLENQIPTCVLRRMIKTINSNMDKEAARVEIGTLLLNLCRSVSPLPIEQTITESEAGKHAHLLDLLYNLIVPSWEQENVHLHRGDNTKDDGGQNSSRTSVTFKRIWHVLEGAFGKIRMLLEYIIKCLKNVPILLPIGTVLEQILKAFHLVSSTTAVVDHETDGAVPVTIPSVSELHNIAGIHFRPLEHGGIRGIRFDEKKKCFFLPRIRLDENTEVILRNLVAYEALTKRDYLIFTRYTELMRAIIDTVEDVEILIDSGIIDHKFMDKKPAEELFNGMSKSIGPTNTPDLENEIKKVNEFFDNTEKVRAYRIISKYVYSSWKLCTLLATLVLLALMVLQTFCSVYDCPKILKTGTGTGTT
ncbi:hypothetical protein PIB30_084102 [Stylosanthes scabra]|uniref:Uncharacterized protein n=1 Tax=Stylosanthes scabra TaxID=79078 RepID=A0ABU6WQT8_9FABA|nr:hypothetical protein [Stylosanthes scabra]